MASSDLRAKIQAIDRRVDELVVEIERNKDSSKIDEAIKLLREKELLLLELKSNDN